jgi:hypothetical protein
MTYLRRLKPLVSAFEMVHSYVKLPEVSVSKELVIYQVELPSSMGETVAITFPGEVHPSTNQLVSKLETYSG